MTNVANKAARRLASRLTLVVVDTPTMVARFVSRSEMPRAHKNAGTKRWSNNVAVEGPPIRRLYWNPVRVFAPRASKMIRSVVVLL